MPSTRASLRTIPPRSIHNNRFITSHGGLLTAKRVKQLDFYDNVVKETEEKNVFGRRPSVTYNNCGIGKMELFCSEERKNEKIVP